MTLTPFLTQGVAPARSAWNAQQRRIEEIESSLTEGSFLSDLITKAGEVMRKRCENEAREYVQEIRNLPPLKFSDLK
ncbi:MAG: hypothetical protein WBI41_11850 [Azovibrio sp.]|uniref:hypothetical protein n=1 Tax=Azovibrio sp. TaxID=1872673 RepID=UPI003C713D98